jgi:DNA-binding winged helix-turn-helix (wHTH) protein
LTQLVKHHHRVVAKIELFDSAWVGRFVGDTALSIRIKAIRQALGDNGRLQHTIRTVRCANRAVLPSVGRILPTAC